MIWMLTALAAVVWLFVWSAMVVAAEADDLDDRMEADRRARAALGRAVAAARTDAVQRPSLWETAPGRVPAVGECVRCYRQLDIGRNAICTGCTGDDT